jgi:pimeloyl-ACP methyl ester carboxylesterase
VLEYETFGPPEGRPLLLINGMVAQLTMYPVGFCRALADAGFQVIRFDNRDAGLSTAARPPARATCASGWRAPRPGTAGRRCPGCAYPCWCCTATGTR